MACIEGECCQLIFTATNKIAAMLHFLIYIIGLSLFFWKPKIVFLYWLLIMPVFLPIYFFFYPVYDATTFYDLYFNYKTPLAYLAITIFCLTILEKKLYLKDIKGIVIPMICLFMFLVLQNFLRGFHVKGLFWNIRAVVFFVAPLFALLINKKVRPEFHDLKLTMVFIIVLQLLFSVLNLLGYHIYPSYEDDFSDHLISGTFARYNHMTNYICTMYMFISLEYFNEKSISRFFFVLLTIISGLLILFSGSRMCLILFVLIFGYFTFKIMKRKKIFLMIFLGGVLAFISLIIGNNTFAGQNADEGTGFERNLIGIINLANSTDLSEGSTLGGSFYLFLYKSDHLLLGNGMAYRMSNYYLESDTVYESVFLTDARLAFMIVEYGIIGLALFAFLIISMMVFGSKVHTPPYRNLLWLPLTYYFLFSITDEGVFDIVLFSMLFIYLFSIKKGNNKINNSTAFLLNYGK